VNRRLIFFALPVFLLAGCRADKEPILFSSEPSPPAAMENAAPPVKKMDAQDLFAVKRLVYGYLLLRHFWDDKEYSAVFLEGDNDEVDALIREFPDHTPPVKPGYRAELFPNRTPVDKDTGRPAMILSADVLESAGDTVEVVGKWYAGGAVSGFYDFSLQKTGGDWIIKNVK
jgi:hypothetical protein